MVTQQKILDSLLTLASDIKENRQFLTDLDAAIGDGDHGINLDRGFDAVVLKLPSLSNSDIGTIFKTVGMTLVSTVGGASGPLYGTAFLRVGTALGGKKEIDSDDILSALQAAQEGIQTRGKAVYGEKTMLDALIPAIDAFKESKDSGDSLSETWQKTIQAAQDGVKYTSTIIATKGRASYLGERSLGHQDPGATSLTLMLKSFA